jgi:hypothetical protein
LCFVELTGQERLSSMGILPVKYLAFQLPESLFIGHVGVSMAFHECHLFSKNLRKGCWTNIASFAKT